MFKTFKKVQLKEFVITFLEILLLMGLFAWYFASAISAFGEGSYIWSGFDVITCFLICCLFAKSIVCTGK